MSSINTLQEIQKLKSKIVDFQLGKLDEEKFKLFRLTRGVYGQRQQGVQMIRTKIPFGKLTTNQLLKIADVSDKYSNGNLHLTTRQNIQLHHVRLVDSPKVWEQLNEAGVTLMEACGNTVRNITASAIAGIDPNEPFDVSPCVKAFFNHFLNNPVGNDMGRKIKIAFSSSESDSAFTYFHDIGFIPKIKNENGAKTRGFKVVIGGGLGAQSIIAQTAYEFLPEEDILQFSEAVIRVFDRYGEREKRFKARMKFLVKSIGLEQFLELVEEEKKVIPKSKLKLENADIFIPSKLNSHHLEVEDTDFLAWKRTNVFSQKQEGFSGVYVKIQLGNISSEKAREFVEAIKNYASTELRLTINQGILLKYVPHGELYKLYSELKKIGLAEIGFDSINDVTACPGSDTCNLAVTNSTHLAVEIEDFIHKNFYDLIFENNISIKISGCMNSCGQHMAASIGLHGSSIKHNGLVVPAMQLVLGGGVDKNGNGLIAEKIIKLPTKRILNAISFLLNDYLENREEEEPFNYYFLRNGKIYFYDLLKPISDLSQIKEEEYVDWGASQSFTPEIGVGECAGVMLDVVDSIFKSAEEKLELAHASFLENQYSDAAYHTYASFIVAAKALLLSEDIASNSHYSIIQNFDEKFIKTGKFFLDESFESLVLKIKENEPTISFTKFFIEKANAFLLKVIEYRNQNKLEPNKLVINDYYKA
jgi:sulfite reductase (ferredoxin)